MSDLQVTLILCDDLQVSLNGKMTIVGTYTGDIGIHSDPGVSAQLVFLFLIQGPATDFLKSARVEIQFPGYDPVVRPITMPTLPEPPPGRTVFTYRYPVTVMNQVLRPGKIQVKFVSDKGEIVIPAPWIVAPSAPKAEAAR